MRLERGDPMLKLIDLVYATSTHAAQGATSGHDTRTADSRESTLVTTSLLRVLATRMREGVTTVVDDGARAKRAAGRQSGDKIAASEVVGTAKPEQTRVESRLPRLELELEHTRERNEGFCPSPPSPREDVNALSLDLVHLRLI